MLSENKAVCNNCSYYSDGLGEKGYCKLYHHKIREPEYICSRYEIKKNKKHELHCFSELRSDEDRAERFAQDSRRLSYLTGIVETIILSIVSIIIAFLFGRSVALLSIPIYVKIVAIAITTVVFVLFTRHLVMMLRRHRKTAFVVYTALTIALLILLGVNFYNVWIFVTDFIEQAVRFVFLDTFRF